MKLRQRKIGEILVSNGAVSEEQIKAALEIQKKETRRLSRKKTVLTFIAIAAVPALFTYHLSSHEGIIIREAKIVTGVDSDIRPLKVTNLFSKNTSKVCAWISWRDAKINTQLLVKWYYLTDDTPIYDYSLNIPKREGVANVVLSMPEGKTLPSGSYKVTISLGKKQLAKPLVFEIE